MAEINIHQHNTNGPNKVSLSLDGALRPYDAELSVVMKTKFLDDASENLIRDGKLYRNDECINKVKQYLDENKFCLIKAPEGRGKTYLSRIIAYDYHTIRKMKVYFLDIKISNGITVNEIEDKLLEWHEDKNNNYLIIIENVHAYEYLDELMKRIKKWIDPKENHFWFLLNARPTDIELEEFSNWEEIVELKPNKDDVNGIIDLFAQEVQREPFANDKERDAFVEKIYSDNKKGSGANLRLQRIYLETWQYNPNIKFISGVSEDTVIIEFSKKYLKDGKKYRPKEEVEALWYISSLYQFDVPLHEDFVQSVGNLVGEGLLRFEGNRYHLPHSVDATFLYKAICDYKGKDYVDQMKTFAARFVKGILASDCPKDFESDFRLFKSGLFARKGDFKKVIYYLTSENLAKEIITKIYYGFVLKIFRPENHEIPNPDALIKYYLDNKGWLIPSIQKCPAGVLNSISMYFKNHLNHNIVKDIFEDAKDLDDYLGINYNYNLLFYHRVLDSITELGEGHKTILNKHLGKNKALLRPMLFKFSPIRLYFVCRTYLNLGRDIVKDIFEDTKDLDDYLNQNIDLLIEQNLLDIIAELGEEHRTIFDKHLEKNKTLLKPMLFKLSPTRLYFVYRTYLNLAYNIIKDFFEFIDVLDDYLCANNNYKLLIYNQLLIPIAKLGAGHKTILLDHYKKNKRSLKPLLLEFNPTKLLFVYLAYKNYLKYDIVKDVFEYAKDLDDYLKNNEGYKFQDDDFLRTIMEMGDEHKHVLEKHNAYSYFFYSKPIKNGFRINHGLIYQFWKKHTFDVNRIKNNRFYFDGVSWSYLQRFVSIIRDSMTEENRQQSINIVKTIINVVLAKENALSYATAKELSYFYYNIASVDETIFQKLTENHLVQTDIKRRLDASSYSVRDLYLFDLFYSQSWCKDILVSRILNADNAQQKIIKAWHDEFMKKLKDQGKEITSGSLLDYIHCNPVLQSSFPEDRA